MLKYLTETERGYGELLRIRNNMRKPEKGKWYINYFAGIRSPWEYRNFNPYIQIYCIKLKVDLPKESLLSKEDYTGFIWKIQPFNWYQRFPEIDKVFTLNEKLRYIVWKITRIKLGKHYIISFRKFW